MCVKIVVNIYKYHKRSNAVRITWCVNLRPFTSHCFYHNVLSESELGNETCPSDTMSFIVSEVGTITSVLTECFRFLRNNAN